MSDIALELARKIVRSLETYEITDDDDSVPRVAALLRPHVWDWIPVGERLPELTNTWKDGGTTFKESVPVLVHIKNEKCRVAYHEGSGAWSEMGGGILHDVTHWAALPSAPSLESSDQK